MKRWIVLFVLTSTLPGCMSAQEAFYRKPGETQTVKCNRLNVVVVDIWSGVNEGSRYADCKSRLEEAGYVRVGPDPQAISVDIGSVRRYRGPNGQEVWCGYNALRDRCIREAEQQGWTRIDQP